jgi:hypothetical protein
MESLLLQGIAIPMTSARAVTGVFNGALEIRSHVVALMCR